MKKISKTNEIADPETTTPNGCTCNSLCGATIDDAFTLDWCTVNALGVKIRNMKMNFNTEGTWRPWVGQ